MKALRKWLLRLLQQTMLQQFALTMNENLLISGRSWTLPKQVLRMLPATLRTGLQPEDMIKRFNEKIAAERAADQDRVTARLLAAGFSKERTDFIRKRPAELEADFRRKSTLRLQQELPPDAAEQGERGACIGAGGWIRKDRARVQGVKMPSFQSCC